LNIKEIITEHREVLDQVSATLEGQISAACVLCVQALLSGHKILLAGNGGSAADAQHLAAEFVGRFVSERISLPAIALTTDTSALTAIANDYGFESVFARQLSGLGTAGDVFIGISTSGNSPNIVQAVEVARAKGLKILLLLGNTGGALKGCGDIEILIPSVRTARVQEMHILIGHIICEAVDVAFAT
jgi:D-sedoheptulose 7-phosphate isomerase